MNWNTLETKPESGTDVLVLVKEMGSFQILKAYWAGKYEIEKSYYTGDDDRIEYNEEKDEYYLPEGWYETNTYDDYSYHINSEVLYWMPLTDLIQSAEEKYFKEIKN